MSYEYYEEVEVENYSGEGTISCWIDGGRPEMGINASQEYEGSGWVHIKDMDKVRAVRDMLTKFLEKVEE